MPLLYPCIMCSLKNLGKKCALYMAKIWYRIQVRLSHGIFLKESGPSGFANRTYVNILSSLMMRVCQTLHNRNDSAMLELIRISHELVLHCPLWLLWLTGKPRNKRLT